MSEKFILRSILGRMNVCNKNSVHKCNKYCHASVHICKIS